MEQFVSLQGVDEIKHLQKYSNLATNYADNSSELDFKLVLTHRFFVRTISPHAYFVIVDELNKQTSAVSDSYINLDTLTIHHVLSYDHNHWHRRRTPRYFPSTK